MKNLKLRAAICLGVLVLFTAGVQAQAKKTTTAKKTATTAPTYHYAYEHGYRAGYEDGYGLGKPISKPSSRMISANRTNTFALIEPTASVWEPISSIRKDIGTGSNSATSTAISGAPIP